MSERCRLGFDSADCCQLRYGTGSSPTDYQQNHLKSEVLVGFCVFLKWRVETICTQPTENYSGFGVVFLIFS
jgi:hypothetical protein